MPLEQYSINYRCTINAGKHKNFYFETGLHDCFEYMWMPMKLTPHEFMDALYLQTKAYKGCIYMEIYIGMYDLS